MGEMTMIRLEAQGREHGVRPTRRGPQIGYNHNFRRRGFDIHIQTEDSGARHPHIFTHVFCGGAIIASSRTEYGQVRTVDEVRALMQLSHKDMCSALVKGSLDETLRRKCGADRRLSLVESCPSEADEDEANALDPGVTLDVLDVLERTVVGFLGAALIDQRRKTSVHSIQVKYDLGKVAEPCTDALQTLCATLEALQLESSVDDVLVTTPDVYLILRPISDRFFVYVAASRADAKLGLMRHLVSTAAKVILARE